MNKKSALYSLMVMMASMGMQSINIMGAACDTLTPEELRAIEQHRIEKKKAALASQGVKEWNIDGFTVWARNEKNANRKVNNIKKEIEKLYGKEN